jgi:hypothetical protein
VIYYEGSVGCPNIREPDSFGFAGIEILSPPTIKPVIAVISFQEGGKIRDRKVLKGGHHHGR